MLVEMHMVFILDMCIWSKLHKEGQEIFYLGSFTYLESRIMSLNSVSSCKGKVLPVLIEPAHIITPRAHLNLYERAWTYSL